MCPTPPRAYLELDVTLSPEAFQSHATAAMAHVNHALRLLLRLFLVEDLVDSLKVGDLPPPPPPPQFPRRAPPKCPRTSLSPMCPQLAVAMWLMTYVGAVFNGITLLILGKTPPQMNRL